MKKIKVAVLGCSGLVGRQFVRLLDRHPYFEPSCLTASSRTAGKRFAEALNDPAGASLSAATSGRLIRESTVDAVAQSGAALAFSALPAALAAELESELRRAGIGVFSNAGAWRMAPDVPLLVPEVNPGHLELARRQQREHGAFIVTNPNCVVSGLVLALKPLMAFGLGAVTVTTFQAVSGGGRRGVSAWDIGGNVLPHISGEEEKVARETGKILGRLAGDHVESSGLEVYPSCSRVPVRVGHLMSVSAEMARPAAVEEVAAALAAFQGEPQRLRLPTAPRRPILVPDGSDRPQPLLDVDGGDPERARGMAVSVGRLRLQGRRIAFFLLVHNTVRGAAGGSVLNAELAAKKGLIPGAKHG
ncbi:MAG: aspartate-semialdehyde dehydrogenase [Candidatus Aminicenantes bacterium]|nr:aspartate-semialdehyde dehydrogenase [Candidatus Aminicenantes bacterium]